MYEQMKKNNVSAENQLKKSEFVRIINPGGKGRRVMFAGNSITLHGIKADIGWHNEWGMAASSKEKDYVHILMSKILEADSDAVFCICQVAAWERDYKNGFQCHSMYDAARDFNADIIVLRFVENCPAKEFDGNLFKEEYGKFIDFLNGSENAELIFTTGFWKHPGDKMIVDVAKERNCPAVLLGDLGETDEMKAIGLFEHAGVANHPGDKGMTEIANRIWNCMEVNL